MGTGDLDGSAGFRFLAVQYVDITASIRSVKNGLVPAEEVGAIKAGSYTTVDNSKRSHGI